MNQIVLDANIFLMLYFAEPSSDRVARFLAEITSAGVRIVAPHLLPYEFTNAVRRRMRRDHVPLRFAQDILAAFLALDVELVTDAALHRDALALTERYSLTGFDAHYIALAQRLTCDFWTADQRLLRALAGRVPGVHLIESYQPS